MSCKFRADRPWAYVVTLINYSVCHMSSHISFTGYHALPCRSRGVIPSGPFVSYLGGSFIIMKENPIGQEESLGLVEWRFILLNSVTVFKVATRRTHPAPRFSGRLPAVGSFLRFLSYRPVMLNSVSRRPGLPLPVVRVRLGTRYSTMTSR